jgi:hypothetical protein
MIFEPDWQNGFEGRGPSSRGSQLRFAPLTSASTTLHVKQKNENEIPKGIIRHLHIHSDDACNFGDHDCSGFFQFCG